MAYDMNNLPKAESIDTWFSKEIPGTSRTKHWIPKKKAIINPDTGRVYSVVSDIYKFVSHEEAISRVLDVVNDNPEFGTPEVHINLYQDGCKMQTRIRFPEKEFKITTLPNGIPDTINPEIWVRNSYDFKWLLGVDFGGNRQVCTNGMRAFSTLASYYAKHVTGLNLEEMSRVIHRGVANYVEQIELWRKWSNRLTQPEDYIVKMDMMRLPEAHMDNIHNEVEKSSGLMLSDLKLKTLSYWNFYNIVTQYVEHKMSGMAQANAQAKLGRF